MKSRLNPPIACRDSDGGITHVPADRVKWKPSAYGVVRRVHPATGDDELLMVRARLNDRLLLPGGGQHVGELARDAVIREVREETGVEVRVQRELPVVEEFRLWKPTSKASHVVARVFVCCLADYSADTPVPDTGDLTTYDAHWASARHLSRLAYGPTADDAFYYVTLQGLRSFMLPPP